MWLRALWTISLCCGLLLAGCGSDSSSAPSDATPGTGFQPPAGFVAINFTIDDTADQTYDTADGLAWKGNFSFDPASRILSVDASWGGPFPMLYDDGPWDAGGHEPAGAIAGDHVWGVTVWVSAAASQNFEYGAISGSVDGSDGSWIWTGANGTFAVTSGDSTPIDAAGLVIVAAWQAAQDVATQGFMFDVDGNAAGDAVLVWRQDETAGSSIWARHYAVATDTWGNPVTLKAQGLDVDAPQVAVNAAGDAAAVWVQFEAGGMAVWASTYDAAATTWSAAQRLGPAPSPLAARPQVAINNTGEAIAVWEERDGTRYNLWVATFDNGAWRAAESVNEGIGDAVQGQVVLDDAGTAIVVWIQDPVNGSITPRIHAAIYDFTSGWTRPEIVDPFPVAAAVVDFASLEPVIGMDDAGNAVVAWMLQDYSQGQRNNIWTIRYDAATGIWGNAVEIDGTDDTSSLHQLAVGPTGNAVVAWHQFDEALQQNRVAANGLDATSGQWRGAELLEADPAVKPSVGIDGAGNAVALWYQRNGTAFELWSSNRQGTAGSWEQAQRVSASIVLLAGDRIGTDPQVVVFCPDRALAVWYSSGIWSSSFR
ncbi:MAG: hypothetical protein V1791_16420 [Pseudomonadota bacterium]